MKLLKEIFKRTLIFMLLVILAFVGLLAFGLTANASIEDNTSVINDLSSDPNFNQNDYKDIADDYSLKVIQIGETKSKELIIYVYQPSHKTIDLLGTKISISYGFSKDGKGLEPKLYPLELLSTSDVFDKYLVKNFEVPWDTQRYYNIISIFREFNSSIDGDKTDEGGCIDFTDKAYSVGQQWYAYDINNSVAYEMNTFNTMIIDTIINSHFEFNHGLTWGNFVGLFNKGDCWYIAFNCDDYVIKHIYDADLSYGKKSVRETWGLGVGTNYYYGEEETKTITLTDADTMSYTGEGLEARTFEWNRILSSSEFIENVENNKVIINDDARQMIENSQWVFTYTETERSFIGYDGGYTSNYYDIYDVGILRLHFLDTSGKTYDLGVVNSLTDPTNESSGTGTTKILETLQEFFEKSFMVLGLIVLVIIIMCLSNFLTPFILIIKEIFRAIKYVLSLPFKLIKWVFKRK